MFVLLLTASSGCGDPGTPVNGSRFGEDFGVGMKVMYACNTGFFIEGSRTRVCQANLTWSGIMPTCLSKWNTHLWTECFGYVHVGACTGEPVEDSHL